MEEETPRMAKIKGTASSHCWWFDSHLTSRRSHWLQSTLEELEEKTSSMLTIVEEDADSFAQRAEMYYKKRPELISMVEDFYRMHRSLAEKYDQLKSETGVRVLGSPFASKYHTETFRAAVTDQISDSQSEVYDPDDGAKSEVDDPDHEDERERGDVMQETEADDQLMELRDQLRRVQQENMIQREQLLKKDEEQREVIKKLRKEMENINQKNMVQKEQLLQKDEEKREVIRQLSSAMEMVKFENTELRKMVAQSQRKKNSFQFEKLKEAFMERVFNVCAPKSQATVVAL